MEETEKQMSNTTALNALGVSRACLAVRIRKLNREVSAIYDNAFRPFGVTIAQFNLLISIGAHGSVAPSRLAAVLTLEKSTVSRNVEKLLANGWVESFAHKDKRRHLLKLTEKGSVLVEQVTPAWQLAQKEAEKTIGPLADMIKDISFT
jgi:DNA-binding MarR family transcriptional regulator